MSTKHLLLCHTVFLAGCLEAPVVTPITMESLGIKWPVRAVLEDSTWPEGGTGEPVYPVHGHDDCVRASTCYVWEQHLQDVREYVKL